ncbi:hypothetical protein ACP4OV_016979 [Aristida adscensionis]
MYVVENKGVAIALMLVALLFGGTFGPLMLFTERRGRLPQHIFLDYSIANFLAAVLIALTLGQIGESKVDMPKFFTQLSQDNWPSVLFAMAGGLALNLGGLVSTTMNYFLDGRINRADILFPGVACFLIAIFLGAAVHSSNAKDKEEKLGGNFSANRTNRDTELSTNIADEAAQRISDDSDHNSSSQSKPGTAEFIEHVEKRRSIKVMGSSKLLGLGLAFFAGICFSIFAPAFNLATNVACPKEGCAAPGSLHVLLLLLVRFRAWVLCECLVFVPTNSWCASIKHWSISEGLEW